MNENEYQQRIEQLEREVAALKAKLTAKQKTARYGLVWKNVPEAFEQEAENKIPILEEVKDKAIKNDDGKPTHILIEGDNYHALQCLNYTHKGKIDVIYIDPPYNTGSDGFTYKDKRFLKEFPDGTYVPTDHPLRHSYWLSFMHKRLKLAKNLLSERGVIFISIDDNEQANLKLLCDQVFGEKNFVCTIVWQTKTEAKGIPPRTMCVTNHEYILAYAKNDNFRFVGDLRQIEDGFSNPDNDPRGAWKRQYLQRFGQGFSEKTITNPQNGMSFTFETTYTLEKMQIWIDEGIIIFSKSSEKFPARKEYFSEYENPYKPIVTNFGLYSTKVNSEKLKAIFNEEKVFDYSKPIDLMKDLLKRAFNKTSTILDFFAGSGTTMHATMQLNEEDGGHRQCILVQAPEKTYKIENSKKVPLNDKTKAAFEMGLETIADIAYERNHRVMQGYTNAKGDHVQGLGNSLKYFRTAFVGEHDAIAATDEDKVVLAHKAGNLIAIAENTLEEIEANNAYQIFNNGGNKYTAVYFTGDLMKMTEFTEKLETLRNDSKLVKIETYIYCLGNVQQFENEFINLRRITLHAIPQPIIEIYKQLNA